MRKITRYKINKPSCDWLLLRNCVCCRLRIRGKRKLVAWMAGWERERQRQRQTERDREIYRDKECADLNNENKESFIDIS